MLPPWKLVVEDLGRIAHAEIEARPLLLFVGGNNTGKTYLASLLWGLLSLGTKLPVAHGDAYERCVAWIEERFTRREREPSFELTPDVHADLMQIANDTLREQGAMLAARTFNRATFNVGRVELREVTWGPKVPIPMEWRTVESEGRRETLLFMQQGFGFGAQDVAARANLIEAFVRSFILRDFHGLGRLPTSDGLIHVDPVFLPASRTGFMLLYRSLAQQLVGDSLRKTAVSRPPAPDLTEPAIDFVNLLVGLRPEAGAYPEEAAFLEQAMGGRFALRSDVGLPEVLYEHADGEPALPMQLSSSLVTELAPVVLTLRHVSGYKVLIIEEPEAHLHPHLQRVLAQVIVRLIRKGLFVWITTHSENFCQQINNFLKIGALAPDQRAAAREKLGYGEQDYLDLDDVGGYEFRIEGNRSVVEELTKTPQGLVMPTFNRELFALAKEMDYLDDLAAEGA